MSTTTTTHPFAYTDAGEPLDFPWEDAGIVLIGGVPGSGKTTLLHTALRGLDSDAEVHVFDGKGGFEWSDFEGATVDRSAEFPAVLDALRALTDSLSAPVHPSRPRRVIVLDEATTWLSHAGRSGYERGAVKETQDHLDRIVRVARQARISVVLTSQAPSVAVFPTRFRDIATGIALRLSTEHQLWDTLGELPEGVESPVDFTYDQQGRFVMRSRGVMFVGTVRV